MLVFPNTLDPNPAWVCPKAGAGLAPNAGVVVPNGDPPLLAVFPNKLVPPNADVVCAPNAGVDVAAPNAGEDDPNAGVLCPNNEDPVDPNVELPKADAEVCPNGDGVDPNAGLELACPNAGVDAAPNGFVLVPNVLVLNAGVEAAVPKAGEGVRLPKAGFAAPNGFAVEVEAKGFGVDACPKVAVLLPNGLEAAGAGCPNKPPAAGSEVLAGLGDRKSVV